MNMNKCVIFLRAWSLLHPYSRAADPDYHSSLRALVYDLCVFGLPFVPISIGRFVWSTVQSPHIPKPIVQCGSYIDRTIEPLLTNL